ncbi:LEPR-XLL domain-containing protein [Lactiplantibacillus plantarum]|nr:LEPR-XLL domain-containing protein [Lactiplantibacillus plantarum]RZN72940.1 LEPR-XLL domain-containing protein [Lactiplantibacillus plantarum]TPV66141.1 LEPR-XLL domain-containing protein [Lactiplantibacillus plantarum]
MNHVSKSLYRLIYIALYHFEPLEPRYLVINFYLTPNIHP